MLVVVALIGCKDGNGNSPDLELFDENNYSYAGDLTLAQVEVEEHEDVVLDWSTMTTDIRSRTLVPETVEQLVTFAMPNSPDEAVARIEKNDITNDDDVRLFSPNGATSAALTQFSISGDQPFDFLAFGEDSDTTWFVSMRNLAGGSDVLSTMILVPRAGIDNHDAAFTDSTASLAVDVDMHSMPALSTREGIGPYTLNWTEVTKDVYGAPFNSVLGNELLVAHFATEDLAEIEAGFILLDTNASKQYRMDVLGRSAAELDDAVDDDGNPFEGFTQDGTWLVGILCTECAIPVPLVLAVVDVN